MFVGYIFAACFKFVFKTMLNMKHFIVFAFFFGSVSTMETSQYHLVTCWKHGTICYMTNWDCMKTWKNLKIMVMWKKPIMPS